MIGFAPSRNPGDAERTLATLVRPRLDPLLFRRSIQKLHCMFSAYKAFCPPPWASRNLNITPEIAYQSELWLPQDHLRPHFHSLYRQALTYPPVLSSTPFALRSSWASLVAGFPVFLEHFRNPAQLLEELLIDDHLRLKFLFWSFMPGRFYGSGSNRYPKQAAIVADWLHRRQSKGNRLRCLDAASGDGANTYGIARVLLEQGWLPDRFGVEGWTLEPLEAWAAAHGCFPHDPVRSALFQEETRNCLEKGGDTAIRFCCTDILTEPETAPFDLILCNGLLGGPIIHNPETIRHSVSYLSHRLSPGGMLLAADHFHGGWKKNIPGEVLGDAFKASGLSVVETGEGISGTRI